MALTFRQKQDLDSYVKSIEVAIEERERIRGIYLSERAAYAEYSDPVYDDTKVDPTGYWPPSLVAWVNISGSGTASMVEYDEYILNLD